MKRKLRFWTWILVASALMAGGSLYLGRLLEKMSSYIPSWYEPRDFERGELMERSGKSVLDPQKGGK